MNDTVEITPDSEPQQHHSVEMAMITRAEYELWKSAYDILQRLGELGHVTEDMVRAALVKDLGDAV